MRKWFSDQEKKTSKARPSNLNDQYQHSNMSKTNIFITDHVKRWTSLEVSKQWEKKDVI